MNSEMREVVIMSEAVSPDVLPEEKGVHRVNEYWSTMVIRALGDVDQVCGRLWFCMVVSLYGLENLVWCCL